MLPKLCSPGELGAAMAVPPAPPAVGAAVVADTEGAGAGAGTKAAEPISFAPPGPGAGAGTNAAEPISSAPPGPGAGAGAGTATEAGAAVVAVSPSPSDPARVKIRVWSRCRTLCGTYRSLKGMEYRLEVTVRPPGTPMCGFSVRHLCATACVQQARNTYWGCHWRHCSAGAIAQRQWWQ